MKYLLTIYNDESEYADITPEQVQQVMAAYEAFGLQKRGGLFNVG